MAGIDLAHRLAIMAVINGLRDGGEISEVTINAIAKRFGDAAKVSDDWGHSDTSEVLRKLADETMRGGSGE